MLIDVKKKWAMTICFFLGYNILHCIGKILHASWRGDPGHHPFANRCLQPSSVLLFFLNAYLHQNLSPKFYRWKPETLLGYSVFLEHSMSDAVLHKILPKK